ncbi:TonB-dependent receptor [Acinetobacter boissieri]|uniref:Catecholate siderophore receptor n=1 Tax=Acinetobacter boissieri TaxID=1219383 RepID=A0A1G6GMM2_9GAMM|nr:TonB-dependent siderophore receptor [Acinetobacter boissieri]SDB82965.1 catecholate siderophore receptor [Acinetobacter boissieri]
MKKTILFISILSSLSGAGYAAQVESLPTIQTKADKLTLKQQMTQSSTATKGTLPLKDVPQTVNVIPQEVLKEQGVTSMQGALQNVPGVGFSTGDGQRDQVSIRGFNSVYDSYVDGFRDDAMYYRDLSNTDRIEVVKGPASVLYGRGSAGGLINRVTKKPTAQTVREVALIGNTLGQRRAQIDINQPITDTVKARLTGAVENSGGYRDHAFLERQAVAPSILWDISDKTKLLVQADYLHDNRLADQGFPRNPGTNQPLALNPKVYLGPANVKEAANTDTEVKSATVTLDHQFDDVWKYHGVVHAYTYSLDRQLPDSKYDNKTNTLSISQNRRFRNEKGVATQQEISGKFNTASIEHNVLVGVELSHQNKNDKVFASSVSSNLDINNIVLPVWTPVSTVTPSTISQNNSTNKALYVQDLMSLSEQLKMLVGARYDILDQKRSTFVQKTNKMTPYNRTDYKVSPRIGLVYEPVDNLSLYASYNQSFQPLSDALAVYNNLSSLQPTQTKSYEVGAKWDITPDYNVSLSIFNTTQNNILQADPSNSQVAVVAGEQRTKGFEISTVGQITNKLSVLAGYAYLDSKITKSVLSAVPVGNTAALSPTSAANIWVKYTFDDNWYAAIGGRAQTSQYASSANKLKLPGYTVANASVGYNTEHYDIGLNINNIFDRHYFASAHGLSDQGALIGNPVNAQLSLRYRF